MRTSVKLYLLVFLILYITVVALNALEVLNLSWWLVSAPIWGGAIVLFVCRLTVWVVLKVLRDLW